MRKRRLTKINKIILCVIAIVVLITLPTFGRYVYNNVRDLYLKSQNFSFSSNLLTTTGKSYRYSNWSGIENYQIDLQLYSYENELSLFTYEGDEDGEGLKYTIECEVDDTTKATAHIGTVSGGTTSSGYISNITNIENIKIYLIPTENLEAGDTIKLNVTAYTTEPYKKTIKAEFRVKLTEERISYKIVDSENSIYATLELVNAESEAKQIKLSFDPEEVMIDTSDEAYTGSTAQTTTTKSGVKYINSVTFILEAEQSKNIKFYKTYKTKDYTYPGEYGSMIVEVEEVTQ